MASVRENRLSTVGPMKRCLPGVGILLLAISACGGTVVGETTTTGVMTATTPSTTATTTLAETTSTVESSTTTVTEYDITITGGTDESPELTVIGPDRFEFQLGAPVVITVLSSVDDELHLHGYDIFFDVAAGSVTTVEFVASIPGIFEAELEDSHTLLFEVEVSP